MKSGALKTGSWEACAAAVLLFVASCAAKGGGGRLVVPDVVISVARGVPTGSALTAGSDPHHDVALTADGTLEIGFFGSGSCPTYPVSVTAGSPSTVIVVSAPAATSDDAPAGALACTADLSPTTSTVEVPAGVDVRKPFHVIVDGYDHLVVPR